MIVNNGYGVISTPSENTDVTGSAGSPQGPNSSLLGYLNVEAGMPGGYVSPTINTGSSQYFKQIAIRTYLGGEGNIQAPYNYGPNH